MTKSPNETQTEYFNSRERVRLTFLLKDLFPIPQKSFYGQIKGFEWNFLYELLQRTLGRKEIGSGLEAVGALEDFITLRATEGELLTMLQLTPFAYVRAFEHTRSSPYEQPSKTKIQGITSAINAFLERIGSPAHFTADGTFVRSGFADETPAALRGLPDRERLRSDVQTLLRGNTGFAVIFIDLDNFKAVNDTRGHAAGDRCLEEVVSAAGTAVAYKGKLYRYGGDEFVVVLPNSTAPEAAATAERIRRDIEVSNAGGATTVTASVGVAASDVEGIDSNRLIESADAAMYASKKSKKNCVTVWRRELGSSARQND